MTDRRRLLAGFLGSVPYPEAVAAQLRLRSAVKRGEGEEHLLLLEHPHVYTLGRNAGESDILLDSAALAEQGIQVAHCDRGGQVTYHGPGQLVGYPILNLSPDRRDIRRFMQDLQASLVATLARFGVEAVGGEGKERIGLWVGDAKIASLGVHLSRWLTTHGFALNVTTDLAYFSGIVPCGLSGVRMTSIESLTEARPSLLEVAEVAAEELARRFDRQLIWRSGRDGIRWATKSAASR